MTGLSVSPKTLGQDSVYQILQPAIYISKAEAALNLPPKVNSFPDVDLSPQQTKALSELRKNYLFAIEGGLQVTAANAAVLFGKIQQVFTGAIYATSEDEEDGRTAVALQNTDREQTMVEIIRDAMAAVDAPDNVVAGKTLVFVPFRHVGERIMEVCAKKK